MPIVRIEMLEGRSAEVKAELGAAITQAMSSIAGANPDQTTVIIAEMSPDNWISGGLSVSARRGAASGTPSPS